MKKREDVIAKPLSQNAGCHYYAGSMTGGAGTDLAPHARVIGTNSSGHAREPVECRCALLPALGRSVYASQSQVPRWDRARGAEHSSSRLNGHKLNPNGRAQ